MTFLTNLGEQAAARVKPAFGLTQHGRAGMEFLGSAQKFSSGYLRPRAKADFLENAEAAKLNEAHVALADNS